MWLLNVSTRDLESFESSKIPPYVILSHRWIEDEPSFKDVQKKRHSTRKGYAKVDLCCQQAEKHGFQYVWVDTCCIDKRSSAELSEAINSMYSWYAKAAICYVYLSDVTADNRSRIESQWFTRGWTLQELLAPSRVEFYNSTWKHLGDKVSNASQISRRTGIPSKALHEFRRDDYPIAQRMSWAANRTTTRPEDRAYSLLGIFDVSMPLLYGEGGGKAFYRLQEEIMKLSTDPTIFAWSNLPNPTFGMLAASPDSFLPLSRYGGYTHLEDKTKIKSFVSDYVHAKAGISGTFSFRQHAFNIYVADVAELIPHDIIDQDELPLSLSQHHPHLGIFLQYFPSEGTFHRIQFDGAYCIELESKAYTRTACCKRRIDISRCPPRSETSSALSNFACRKLSLFMSLKTMFNPGWLSIQNAPRQSDTNLLMIGPISSNSFVAGPCLVLENKLYIHFAYNLHQQLTVFISKFEGNMVTFMLNGENLYSPAPAASIEPLFGLDTIRDAGSFSHSKSGHAYPHKKQKVDSSPPLLHAVPPLRELLKERTVKLGNTCRFTFVAQSDGRHRVLLSFNKGIDSSNFGDLPVPRPWCIAPPLSHKLWEVLDQEVVRLDQVT